MVPPGMNLTLRHSTQRHIFVRGRTGNETETPDVNNPFRSVEKQKVP